MDPSALWSFYPRRFAVRSFERDQGPDCLGFDISIYAKEENKGIAGYTPTMELLMNHIEDGENTGLQKPGL